MKILKSFPKARRAIVTRAKNDYELALLTHPIIEKYAEKCKADFIVINEEVIKAGSYSYEIFQCYDLFNTYERILIIDSDVIVTENCPIIFDLVPYDSIGTIYEDKLTRKPDRRQRIKKVQEKFGQVAWKAGYINTGFFLASLPHREIFKYEPAQIWNSYGYDDVYIGYRICKLGLKVFELPYCYNHMSAFSERGRNWLKSYVIHYAGRGFSGKKSRAEQIKEDLRLLSEKSPMMLNFCHPFERLRLIAFGLYQHILNLTSK